MSEREDPTLVARQRMVVDQLQRRGVRDPRVLEAMARVPRHRFVPDAEADLAYGDHPLVIGSEQTISQPYMVGCMTEALQVGPGDRVLEIGTGSGYQTAVLAELGCGVYSIERLEALADAAERRLTALGYRHVRLAVGDGSLGWPDPSAAPFDGIIVTAGAPDVPAPLAAQLAEGGRLVIPIGGRELQTLEVFTRRGERLERRSLCECRFVHLLGEAGWSG